MKKMKVKMNEPIYLGMLILDISKTLMYEFWYDYTDTDIFRYMVTDSFIFHIKTEEFYREIVDDIKKWFDTSSYSEDDKRPLPRGMNRKVIGWMKYESDGKIMVEFVALRTKRYSYLTANDNNVKKAKETKNYIIKIILKTPCLRMKSS